MDKLEDGQVEIVLIVPLLLCILLLNVTLIEFFDGQRRELQNFKEAYQEVAFGYYYFTDPASGNSYPMTFRSVSPQTEGA